MLLIFGLTVLFKTLDEGVFHCPNCGGDREYRRRLGRRWFTLFFLPVIPLNRVGEIVECRTCRTRYSVDVLRVPTTGQLAAAHPVAMRAAVALVLRAGDASAPAARRRAIEAVRGAGAGAYGDAELDADLANPAELAHHQLAAATAPLAPEAREWFLAEAVRVGLADGPLTDAERQALLAAGASLGLTAAQSHGVIALAEQAAAHGG